VSIKDDNLRAFHDYANKHLAQYNFGENSHDVNFIRDANSTDLAKLILEIGSLSSIWGQGNKEPLIYIKPVTIDPKNIMLMGSNKEHLKININGVDYVKFFATDLIEELQSAKGLVQIEMVCKANVNEWMGQRKPQMMVDDCEISKIDTSF
jgi:single-stranded DNA-specific DHH superfamily exonuclease